MIFEERGYHKFLNCYFIARICSSFSPLRFLILLQDASSSFTISWIILRALSKIFLSTMYLGFGDTVCHYPFCIRFKLLFPPNIVLKCNF